MAKPDESVVEKLVKDWSFDPTIARRLYYQGEVLTCDRCRDPFLRVECRTSLTGPYTGIDEDTFGTSMEGEDICRGCLPEKARAHLFDTKPLVLEGACADCAGKGRLHCPYCQTLTRVECTACAGVGGEECQDCIGEGKVTESCSVCDGSGREGFLKLQKCYKCDGKGTIRAKCKYCNGERLLEECENCGGSGKVSCPHCSGAGTIKCPSCNGMGKKGGCA